MHSLRKASLALLLGATAVTALAADLPETLAQMRAAHGGAAWDQVGWLRMDAGETTDGLHGKVSMLVDRATGQFVRRTEFKLYRVAEGIDEAGRWRQDSTRGFHALDSGEARTVAASESWLNRRGYLDRHDNARWRDAGTAVENGVALDRLEAIPPGGRAVTLWLDHGTHLVRRAEMQLSSSRFVQRYDGYRASGTLVLPSRVATEAYETESVFDHVVWSAPAAIERKALARPAYPVDARGIAGGAASATMPIIVNERGILVRASIDGKGPYFFILDTGASAILGKRAADALGLKGAGAGSISGVGGAIQTEVARVGEVALGAASMRDIPFLIHDMPRRVFTLDGRETEIAGFLGLEVFERFAVRLDLPNQQMTLTPLASYQPGPARGEQLPLHFTDDVPLATASINGHLADVMIDTGNLRRVTVLGAFAKRTGIDKAFEGGKQVKVRGGSGAQAVHVEGQVARLELGSHVYEQLPANVAYEEEGPLSSRSEGANLSLDLLKNFDVTFDYKHGLMTIAPSRPAAEAPTGG